MLSSREQATSSFPPLSHFHAVLLITDKIWFGFWQVAFTHSHDTSHYNVCPPTPPPPRSPSSVSPGRALINVKKSLKEMPAYLEETTHCCSSCVCSDEGFGLPALSSRGGVACLVTISQNALWHCGWCAKDLTYALCRVQDQVTGPIDMAQSTEATGTGRACELGKLSHESTDLFFFFFSGQEIHICRC